MSNLYCIGSKCDQASTLMSNATKNSSSEVIQTRVINLKDLHVVTYTQNASITSNATQMLTHQTIHAKHSHILSE